MRVLVTGAGGFAGSHLVKQLLSDGHDVWGVVRPQEKDDTASYPQVTGDLLEPESLNNALAESRPDVVFHLAGQADVGLSWKLPSLTIRVNTIGTVNLLEAIIAFGRPRVVAVTSADLYGPLPLEAMPINEISQPRPYHPYAVSKLAASQMLALYFRRYQLEIIEARPFNHIGPGQGLGFVVPDFASQVAAIKVGKKAPRLRVGNLQAERDFTDVRDVVRAYTMLAAGGTPGQTYLVCSGRPVPIHQLLDSLIDLADVKVEINDDVSRMRPSDTPCLYGSNDLIRREVGWLPEISLQESLRDVLLEWIDKLSGEDAEK